MSYEAKLKPCQDRSRPDVLEPHLGGPEGTLAVLLEQAFLIREEVAAGLQSTKGSLQVEALSRKLLESHILTITNIVKKLSTDIQAVERQISQRDSVHCETTRAVQSLDQKNLAGIGDLRGRVSRCDASIAKLRADICCGERQAIKLQQQIMELRSLVDVKLKEQEVKRHHELRGIEASLTELSHSQRNYMSDLHKQVKLLEDKMSGGMKEANEQTGHLRKWTEQQLDSSNQTHAQSSQQLGSRLQDKMLEAESRTTGQMLALEARVDQADQRQADQLKHCETELSGRMASMESRLHRELQLLKQDHHKGFQSVHDAIESLRQIGDIKSRADKERLQKDIRLIYSKMAEINDP